MSETAETLKKALMFQLKNPDGSVNWMMTVFVWVLLLLILFALIYVPIIAAKKKSKFGNTNADEPLTIYLRSGMKDWSEAYNKSLPYIFNTLAPISALSIKNPMGREVQYEMVQESTGPDEMTIRQRVDYDATLGNTTQIVYSSGLKSLFGDMPNGTVLVELTTLSPNGSYVEPVNSTLQRYTDPRIVWLRLRFNIGLNATARNAIIAALERIVDPATNVAFRVTSWTSDSRVSTAGRMEIDVVGGGRLRPDAPGFPWFDHLGDKTSKPVTILVLDNIASTWSGFTQQQRSTLVQAAAAARTTRPAPTFQSTYLIEAPASKMDVANAVAAYLRNVKHFAPYETTTVKIETSDSFNIVLVSMSSSLGLEWKRLTMPVLLTTVPADIRVTSDQICQAVTSSVKMYNSVADAPEPRLPKMAGPTVIRIEGDMDPVYMRSRLESMNYMGNVENQLMFIFKYIQNKNRNRPRGTVYAYLESYDQKFVSTLPAELQTMVARIPMGSFLGMTKAHYLVNGIDTARGAPNPLVATDREIAQAADPLANFMRTGKGSLPSEEDIINSLGCPTSDPCPSCPSEKICPTPDPCPSCPTFDVATMCPKPEPCPTFDLEKMCPSKPVWPLKAAIPTTAKSFTIYYTSKNTPATFAASLAEAVQMRITFAEKPNANLKIVARTGYTSGQFGIEVIDPVTKKAVVRKVTVTASNVRKGVEDIYTILAPYL